MTDNNTKKIIVVLGAGRCGTSLLMQVLSKLGMSVSENLVPAKAHNTLGPMEDAELASIYDRDILPQIGSNRVLPIPYVNFTSDLQNTIRSKLISILEKNINASNTIWGFKDPYTACLLPIWFRIFNQTGIVPVFLLTVRNPAQSAISRRKHFGITEPLGELTWLVNYTDALHYTAADCFIVHYEEWFARPSELGRELLNYTGLDQYFAGDIDEVLKEVIKPNLNRAVYDEYTVKNHYVIKLYELLKECHGNDFDRARLMQTVKECRTAMDGFKGWYLEAQNHLGQKATLHKKMQEKTDRLERKQNELEALKKQLQQKEYRLDEAGKQVAKLKTELNQAQNTVDARVEKLKAEFASRQREMEDDLQKLTLQNNEYLKQMKDLHDDINIRQQEQEMLRKNLQEKTDLLEKKRENSDQRQTELETLKKQLQQKENRLDEVGKQVVEMEEDLQELTLQNNEYLRQMKDQHDEVVHLRRQISSLNQRQAGEQPKNKVQQPKKKMQDRKSDKSVRPVAHNGTKQSESRQLQKWKRKAIELRQSYSFRLGQVLINAVLKPGKNTLLMPYYLTQLAWDIITGRGRRKMKQELENSPN